jgi:hypothetical protein
MGQGRGEWLGDPSMGIEFLFFLFPLFICAYNDWVITPPFPLFPSPAPTPLLPSRNCFALISNFVEERV